MPSARCTISNSKNTTAHGHVTSSLARLGSFIDKPSQDTNPVHRYCARVYASSHIVSLQSIMSPCVPVHMDDSVGSAVFGGPQRILLLIRHIWKRGWGRGLKRFLVSRPRIARCTSRRPEGIQECLRNTPVGVGCTGLSDSSDHRCLLIHAV